MEARKRMLVRLALNFLKANLEDMSNDGMLDGFSGFGGEPTEEEIDQLHEDLGVAFKKYKVIKPFETLVFSEFNREGEETTFQEGTIIEADIVKAEEKLYPKHWDTLVDLETHDQNIISIVPLDHLMPL